MSSDGEGHRDVQPLVFWKFALYARSEFTQEAEARPWLMIRYGQQDPRKLFNCIVLNGFDNPVLI